MSQQSSVALHPVLQAALKSLDLKLEMELLQYRCHKAVRSFSPPVPLQQDKPNETSIPAAGEGAMASKRAKLSELKLQRASSDRDAAHVAALEEDKSLIELTRYRLNPDGYLESSEALVRNLQQKPFRPFQPARTLVLTWRILAMVLLLTSAGSAYLLRKTPQLSKSPQPASSSTPASLPPLAARSPDSASNLSFIAPDLSAEEFVKLDLPNLSQAKSSSNKVQPAGPMPLTPDRLSADAGVPVRRSQPTTGPAQSLSSPHPLSQQKQSPRPSSATTKTAKAASLKGEGYWYVLVNDTGNSVLQQVHKIVKDAYVRDLPEGKRIQVGAFNDRQPAQELVEALKRAGITATIRQP